MRVYSKRSWELSEKSGKRLPRYTWDRHTKQAISRWVGLESLQSRVMLSAGPFGLASFTPLGDTPVVVAGPKGINGATLLDLNNDGMGDLIVEYGNEIGASSGGSSTFAAVSALLVNADGSSREYRIARYTIPASAPLPVIDQVLVGDVNGDGLPDVAVLHNDGTIITTHRWIDIFIGHPDGTFTEPAAPVDLGTAIETPTMSLFDQNGDGKTDIFLENTTKLTAYLGHGDGTFSTSVVTDFQAFLFPLSLNKLSSITKASFQQDLNGDGIPDLVVSGLIPSFVQSGNHHALYVFKGQASGAYNLTTPMFTDTSDNLTLLAMRQLSSDNKLDIVAYGTQFNSDATHPSSIFVFRNSGSGSFTQSFHSATFDAGLANLGLGLNGAQPLLTPDLTNDGNADMILVEGPGTSNHMITIHIEKNNGNAGFTETQQISFVSNSLFDDTGLLKDVDGDGLPDLVVYSFTGNNGTVTTTIYFNNGGGTFDTQGFVPSPSPSVTPASRYPGLADFNHDGKLDLIYTGFNAATQKNVIDVQLNTTGRAFGPGVETVLVPPAVGVNLAHDQFAEPDPLLDYTGDGFPDLLAHAGTGPFILAGTGDGHFTTLEPPVTLDAPKFPIPTDFNHDGKIDLLWGNSTGVIDNTAVGLTIVMNGVAAPVDTAGADPETARDLGTLTGPISLSEFVNSSVAADFLDATDYYKFTLTSSQAVRVTAVAAVGGVVGVTLQNSLGQAIGNILSDVPVVDATLEAGTYYVGVVQGSPADTRYRLDIDFPSAFPAIGVHSGQATLISGQTTSIDFGNVLVTTTDTHKVFTISNDGLATLHISGVTLPSGFQLDGAGPPSTLAPGEYANFSVMMNTSSAGQYSGTVTIITTDDIVDNFSFPVTGSVSGPALTDLSGAFASAPALPSSLIAGLSAPLSFTLTNAGPGAANGTYSVAFKLEKGTAQLGKGDVAAGTASGAIVLASGATTAAISGTFTVPANLAPGTYYLAATITHGGDVDTNGADKTFFSGPITIGAPPTHIAFLVQPTVTIAGQVIAPAVKVELMDGSNHLVTGDNANVTIALTTHAGATLNGTLTVAAVNGIATFNDLSLTVAGSYTFTATSGAFTSPKSASFMVLPDASSASLFIAHQPIATTVGLSLTPSLIVDVQDEFGNIINTGTYASSTVTLAVVAGPAGGNFNGSSTLSVKAVKGIATFSKAALSTAGSYTLGVTDGTLGASPTAQFTQSITQGASSVAAPHPANSYLFGQTITLTSVFKSTAPATIPFTGTASILDQNSRILGTAALSANGATKFALTGVVPGTYTCTIDYPGDTNHTGATSSTFTLVINPAATKTVLTSSATTLVFGQTLTLTATVSSTTAPNTPRTGSINFFDGATLLQNVVLSANTASWTFTPVATGNHHYTAVYVHDTNFAASTSAALVRTVNKDKMSIGLTLEVPATTPMPRNQTFNLEVQVAAIAPGSSVLTANLVTIKDNGKVLGTINLDSGGEAGLLNLNYTSTGVHSLTAVYAGDADTLAVTSTVLKLTIT